MYIYGAWIDARTLHNELGVKKKFADWIKTRIDKYEFIENDDYKLDFPKRGNQTSHGGDRKSLYYSLTLDWKLTVAKTGKRKNVKVIVENMI